MFDHIFTSAMLFVYFKILLMKIKYVFKNSQLLTCYLLTYMAKVLYRLIFFGFVKLIDT